MSEEFRQFLKCNGVKQVSSVSYHPSSNGLSERTVQIVKKELRKITDGTRIAKVLFANCNTPHYTSGSSPAKLLLEKQLHSQLET